MLFKKKIRPLQKREHFKLMFTFQKLIIFTVR